MRSTELYGNVISLCADVIILYEEILQVKGKHQVFNSLEKIQTPQLCQFWHWETAFINLNSLILLMCINALRHQRKVEKTLFEIFFCPEFSFGTVDVFQFWL